MIALVLAGAVVLGALGPIGVAAARTAGVVNPLAEPLAVAAGATAPTPLALSPEAQEDPSPPVVPPPRPEPPAPTTTTPTTTTTTTVPAPTTTASPPPPPQPAPTGREQRCQQAFAGAGSSPAPGFRTQCGPHWGSGEDGATDVYCDDMSVGSTCRGVVRIHPDDSDSDAQWVIVARHEIGHTWCVHQQSDFSEACAYRFERTGHL